MPPTCTVCRLEKRQEAEKALIAGEPLRSIAERFGTSPQSLLRHKDGHFPARLVKAKEAREADSAESLTAWLSGIEDEARRLGQKAEKGGDLRTALLAVRELLRQFELKAKVWATQQQASGGQDARPKLSPEETRELTLLLWVSWYTDDPAAFLEELREKAARAYVAHRS